MFVDNYQMTPGSEMAGADVIGAMGGVGWDPGYRRPYIAADGKKYVTINTFRIDPTRYTTERGERKPLREAVLVSDVVNNYGIFSPVFNATALRKEEWLQLDQQVLKATRYRLRAWADLSAASSFGGFNGMSKMVLEHETMSDPGEAIVDMNGITEGRNDAPLFQLEGLPLPITHSDFWFNARKLAISRNTGTPLDSTMSEAAGRRIAETIEKTTIGNQTGVQYGGASTHVGGYGRTSQVYGYINFPTRATKTDLTTPTGSNPEATVADVLSMLNTLRRKKFYGPFMLYHSTDWDQYMDNDYARLGGNNANMTLRDRLRAIEGIQDVRRLDMLFGTADVPGTDPTMTATLASTTGRTVYTGPGGENLTPAAGTPYTLILVNMQPETARAVNGMDITTVQWESKGGMQLNFKVMCIQVPQLRADYYGNCGILQATTGGYTLA